MFSLIPAQLHMQQWIMKIYTILQMWHSFSWMSADILFSIHFELIYTYLFMHIKCLKMTKQQIHTKLTHMLKQHQVLD